MSAARSIALVLLAAASFLGTSALLRPLVPPPESLGYGLKLEVYREHAAEFDAVFIGSSRVIRGLDNRVVDERLTAAGVPFRSFNLALGGCRVFEQDHLLRQVLADPPPRLRYVFLEGGPVGLGLREDHVFRDPPNLQTTRGVHWHTPAETARVLAAILALPVGVGEKLRRAAVHLRICAWNVSNFGRGEAALRSRTRPLAERERRAREKTEILASGGFRGLEDVTGSERSEELTPLLADPTPFLERVAAIPSENALSVSLDDVDTGFHRAQYAAADRAGVRLIHFTPPGLEGTPERLRMAEAGVIRELLHFNDPARYPELFRLDHRFDQGHLNRRGVAVWSAAFADRLLELLGAEE